MDATVTLYAAMAVLFMGGAVVVLLFAKGDAKLFCLAPAIACAACIAISATRAADLIPKPLPNRTQTVTVSCPP